MTDRGVASSPVFDVELLVKSAEDSSQETPNGSHRAAEETESRRPTEKNGSESDGVPYDRGWAWAVAFGCFICQMLYEGTLRSYGLFYVELLHHFNASATETSFFFSIRSGVLSIGSLFVMNILVGHLGVRKTVLMGGILTSLSGILPSLSDDMMVIIGLQSVCLGLGQSMLVSPALVLMGGYFKRRRGLAMPLATCGGSLGGILMPLLVTFFLHTYALSGALLLTGGVCLHALPAALLFRPLSYFTKGRSTRLLPRKTSVRLHTTDESSETTQALTKADQANPHEGPSIKPAFLASSFPVLSSSDLAAALQEKQRSLHYLFEGHEKEDDSTAELKQSVTAVSLQDRTSASPSDEVAVRVASSALSLRRDPDEAEFTAESNSAADLRKESSGGPETTRYKQCPSATSFMLDFLLFRRPLFLMLMGHSFFFAFVTILYGYLPALASEQGITDSQNGVLMSVAGGLDLLCRILCAVIAHFKWLRVPNMFVVSFVVLGVTSQFVGFLTTFYHFLVLFVLVGLFSGVQIAMFGMLVIECVGLDNMDKALGFTILSVGSSSVAWFQLLGYIRDLTGSYVPVYQVIGTGFLLGAGLLCCEKCVRRLEQRVQNNPGSKMWENTTPKGSVWNAEWSVQERNMEMDRLV